LAARPAYNQCGEQLNDNAKLVAGSGPKPTAFSNQFTVRVADNFHYMDESETYTQGSYATYAEAVNVAAQIVCASLLEFAKSGMSGDELFRLYTSFGADPFIVGSGPEDAPFSAWEYAKRTCKSRRTGWGQGLCDNLNKNVLAGTPTS
jgi:hypothetical protein